jgi:hypothetical protein
MITIKEYAKKRKISERTARKQLDRKVALGELARQKGSSNAYIYYEPKYEHRNWHDPFNKTKVARSVQKNEGQGAEVVEESGHVSDPEEVASHA